MCLYKNVTSGDEYTQGKIYDGSKIHKDMISSKVSGHTYSTQAFCYAPRVSAAHHIGRASAWPLWAVQTSGEFGELGSL